MREYTEAQLWTYYRRYRSDKWRNRLVTLHYGLLVTRACVLSKQMGNYDRTDEFISAASDVLMRAVELFDPGRGFKFSVYVTRAITRAILRHVYVCRRQGVQLDRATGGVSSWLVDEKAGLPSGDVERVETWRLLTGGLNARARQVVEMRFLKSMTHKAIGAALGLTRARVGQILQGAYGHVRGDAGVRERLGIDQ